jgi:uncharacterized surface protein with fasciclin (FAS1) repeats
LVAPINSAFGKLPAATVNFLVSPAGKDTLTEILLYHVFPSIIISDDLSDGIMTATLLEGASVTVSVNANGIFFNEAQVVAADILTNNGVVHKIDSVLIPENRR